MVLSLFFISEKFSSQKSQIYERFVKMFLLNFEQFIKLILYA